jgi:septal ring factor EnvC (AmiA/AmiB activator)
MDKKLKLAVDAEVSLERNIVQQQARLADVEEQIRTCAESVRQIEGDLRKALGRGDPSEDLERSLQKSKVDLDRAQHLAAGIRDRLAELESDLLAARQRREETFAALCEKWLRKEMKQYDATAGELLRSIKRLQASFSMLRDLRNGEHVRVYGDTLGEGSQYVGKQRVVLLGTFNRSAYLSEQQAHPSADVIRTVRGEIEA